MKIKLETVSFNVKLFHLDVSGSLAYYMMRVFENSHLFQDFPSGGSGRNVKNIHDRVV